MNTINQGTSIFSHYLSNSPPTILQFSGFLRSSLRYDRFLVRVSVKEFVDIVRVYTIVRYWSDSGERS